MQLYELTYLISPELNEEALEKLSQEINSLIAKTGKVLRSVSPKRMNLAYSIQDKQTAALATFEFQAAPEQIDNLKKELAKEKNILRFLLIKKKGAEKIKKKRELKKIEGVEPVLKKELVESVELEKKVGLKEIGEKLEKVLKE